MNTWQKIINICLTVMITLLIYQNQQLENKIASSTSGDRLDLMDKDRQLIKDSFKESLESYMIEISMNKSAIEAQTKEIDAQIKRIVKTETDIKSFDRDLNSLKRSSKPLSVDSIKRIVEKCKVPTWSTDGLSNLLNHGHDSLKC